MVFNEIEIYFGTLVMPDIKNMNVEYRFHSHGIKTFVIEYNAIPKEHTYTYFQ